jgi:hypothetical protein
MRSLEFNIEEEEKKLSYKFKILKYYLL